MHLNALVINRLAALATALALVAAYGSAFVSTPVQADEPVVVFAAASLSDVMAEVGKAYTQVSGKTVKFSFASSSTLAKQIESGAPVGAFFSADEQWMDYLAQRELIVAASRKDLLGNKLVVVEPASGQLELTISASTDFAALLKGGRLAVGDPEHVPAGIYAKEALTNLGLWDQVKDHLAPADSVRVALALVERAEAPLGIVYATDASSTKGVRVAGVFPEQSHQPVIYPVAVVKAGDTLDARSFVQFAEGPTARAIFQHFGFDTSPPPHGAH